jgi:hypothetical protein
MFPQHFFFYRQQGIAGESFTLIPAARRRECQWLKYQSREDYQSASLEMWLQWSWYPRAHLTAAVGLEVPMVEQKRRIHPQVRRWSNHCSRTPRVVSIRGVSPGGVVR